MFHFFDSLSKPKQFCPLMASIISSMVARSGSVMEDWQKSSPCSPRFENRVITLGDIKLDLFSRVGANICVTGIETFGKHS